MYENIVADRIEIVVFKYDGRLAEIINVIYLVYIKRYKDKNINIDGLFNLRTSVHLIELTVSTT